MSSEGFLAFPYRGGFAIDDDAHVANIRKMEAWARAPKNIWSWIDRGVLPAAADHKDGTIVFVGDVLYLHQSGAWTPISTGGKPVLDLDFDAKGDLIVGSANDAYDNLAVGANGKVLVADSGQTLGVKWGFPAVPACRAYHDADQSLTNDTHTVLSLNSERFDTDTIHDTATNNSRLTCKTAGKYIISANAGFASNVTGERILDILLNGATVIGRHRADANGVNITTIAVSTLYDLAVNDYIEMRAYQNSGGALNVIVEGNFSPEFGMAFQGV